MSPTDITPDDVRAARQRIAGLARVTPLKPSSTLSERLDRPVHLKLESMQDTGAFKLRGAASMILGLSEEARQHGVITVSSGNHGRAVAWVARRLGIPAVICLTRLVPEVKVQAIRSLGAEVSVEAVELSEGAVDKGVGGAQQRFEARVVGPQHMVDDCLLYTSPSPRDLSTSRMPSSA